MYYTIKEGLFKEVFNSYFLSERWLNQKSCMGRTLSGPKLWIFAIIFGTPGVRPLPSIKLAYHGQDLNIIIIDLKRRRKMYHSKKINDIYNELKTDPERGLFENEAARRLYSYGYNELKSKKKKHIFVRFFMQFNDYMVIILLIAAAVSFFISRLSGESDIIDPIIILAIVVLNAAIGLVNESRADKAIENLKKITAPHTNVVREGIIINIKASEIVPGDIFLLKAGDLIPCDGRLINADSLAVEESALTGESLPSEKDANKIVFEKSMIGDRKNMVFSGCVVTAGKGRAVATQTGMNSQIGEIASMLNKEEESETPLQQKLANTGKMLGFAALFICFIIFLLGLFKGSPPLDTFMISISLAVAAIPEGLPAIVTIVLAMGVSRMARNKAIIRRLPVVETLGSATVICCDKTGTLTQNKMTVVKIATDKIASVKNDDAKQILSLAALCNNAIMQTVDIASCQIIDGKKSGKTCYSRCFDCSHTVNVQSNRSNKKQISGEPTETAIVRALDEHGISQNELDAQNKRVKEIAFTSSRKLMTTIHRLQNGKLRIITKGAPDVLMNLCSSFPKTNREKVLLMNDEMAQQALRVLAVAYRDVDVLPSHEKIETNLTYAGLIGMIDPPRKDVKNAIRICKRAGIRVAMITGDHVITAKAIAKELNILGTNDKAITGAELDAADEAAISLQIKNITVFARVSPEHKVRIVKAFQKKGNIVAMTGDGVNDAPALKAADIGCAMGESGTEVAKSAADMILTDDNFTTIVAAVKEGRGIYENIRRSVRFLLSCNIGEVITVFFASLMALPSPLLAIQLLWVNLVTDSLPAISLGMEPTPFDVMSRKPADPKKSMFADGMLIDIIIEGFMIGCLTLLAFIIGRNYFDRNNIIPIYGRTMAFCVLSFSQLVHAFNTRSKSSVFKIGMLSNKRLSISFIICALMQITVVSTPLSTIFKTIPLHTDAWLIVAGLSVLPLVIIEVGKAFVGRREVRVLVG